MRAMPASWVSLIPQMIIPPAPRVDSCTAPLPVPWVLCDVFVLGPRQPWGLEPEASLCCSRDVHYSERRPVRSWDVRHHHGNHPRPPERRLVDGTGVEASFASRQPHAHAAAAYGARSGL